MDIKQEIENYRENCITFMRDLVRIPGESCNEKGKAERIKKEMLDHDFDKAWIDDYGNVIGQVGNGPIRIVFDSHIDTVGIGDLSSWPYDPYEGKIEDGYIYGRGACDNHNGSVPQVYAAALFKKLGKDLDKVSIFVVGSVQEEDCDGLGLRYVLEESVGNVNFVCMGETTEMKIYRGHRGRMEMNVVSKGVSCHGSAPERGDNAIYRMQKLVKEIEELNETLEVDEFLGKGTCAVTHIDCKTPSLCAVPDECKIHIDRRLTNGENKELAVKQIRELSSFDEKHMQVSILNYNAPSHTGKVLKTEKYYPTWVLPEDHPLVKAGAEAANFTMDKEVEISKWIFSTNGVSSMGQLGIPSIGFGPGSETDAHSINDRVKIDDLVKAIAFYTKLPETILKHK